MNSTTDTNRSKSGAIHVVGAGGVASYLLPVLARSVPKGSAIFVWDGDILEERNLDRQLFTSDYIGKNKAEALCAIHGIGTPIPRFFATTDEFGSRSTVFCCVDNNPAKRNVLKAVDASKSQVFLGGNEYVSSQAFYYDHTMQDTRLDPRVRFANILSDDSRDPLNPACTGELQKIEPQLAIFNNFAAGMMLHLFWCHNVEKAKLTIDAQKHCAWMHAANFNKVRTVTLGDAYANQ